VIDGSPKTKQQEINRVRLYWNELFWIIGGEKKSEFNALKRTEVFEFFNLLVVKENTQNKKLNRK